MHEHPANFLKDPVFFAGVFFAGVFFAGVFFAGADLTAFVAVGFEVFDLSMSLLISFVTAAARFAVSFGATFFAEGLSGLVEGGRAPAVRISFGMGSASAAFFAGAFAGAFFTGAATFVADFFAGTAFGAGGANVKGCGADFGAGFAADFAGATNAFFGVE